MALFVYPPVSLSISGGASEATLIDVEQNTQDSADSLATIEAVDFATEAKQDTQITSLNNIDTSLNNVESDLADLNARLGGSLAPVEYDEVVLTYVGATTAISTVVYKLATVTVKTLTLGYDGSDRLTSVVAT